MDLHGGEVLPYPRIGAVGSWKIPVKPVRTLPVAATAAGLIDPQLLLDLKRKGWKIDG